ncbi:MAG TPA: OsmC family protein [Pyrinomonadaceae bacterium]|nr:OsmC family protein [Pyrinomonadaceae bacterium]
MSKAVIVNDGLIRYVQNISVGHHLLQADEPVASGGSDAGPDPYELLLAALGACISITLRMYADRKQWPLDGVQVRLSYARVHAEDCATCDSEAKLIDIIDVEVSVVGDLSEDQHRRLLEIAGKCPVHRTLASPISIRTRPAPQTTQH